MGKGTTVNLNARLEVMRLLALLQDSGAGHEDWPEWTPLFEGEAAGGAWGNPREDIILAVQEATALGHMENRALHASDDTLDRFMANMRGGREWMVKITPAGYAWIKAHDLVGEIEQDAASLSSTRGES